MKAVAHLAPLTPPECDLRSLDWFKFEHKRAARSSWWKRATHVARSINMDLWVEAFQQVPAASLPDEDFQLAGWCGFGRDVDAFLRLKAEIMAPWIKCSDGRWYHPTLAEVAVEAWESTVSVRRKERERKRIQRARNVAVPEEVPLGQDDLSRGTRQNVPAENGNVPPLDKRRGDETKNTIPGEGAECGKVVAGSGKPKPAKAQRATRVPMAWTANEAERKYAEDQGFNPTETRDMEDAFYDFWKAKPGTAGTKLDWAATWRTWVRTEAKRRGGHRGPNGNGSGRSPSPGGRREEREERIGRMLGGAVEALGGKR